MWNKACMNLTVFYAVVATSVTMLLLCCTHKPTDGYTIQDGKLKVQITLMKDSTGNSTLISTDLPGTAKQKISEWKLPYPVYHFECADIDGDGTDDILVGVVKATKFDSVV